MENVTELQCTSTSFCLPSSLKNGCARAQLKVMTSIISCVSTTLFYEPSSIFDEMESAENMDPEDTETTCCSFQ